MTRTADETTVAELMEAIAPPREGTTGVHVTAVGPHYLLTVQGPEAQFLTARILEFVEAMHKKTEEKRGNARDTG